MSEPTKVASTTGGVISPLSEWSIVKAAPLPVKTAARPWNPFQLCNSLCREDKHKSGEGRLSVVTLVDVGVNANANANANANGVAVVWHKPRSTFANGPVDRHVLRCLSMMDDKRIRLSKGGSVGCLRAMDYMQMETLRWKRKVAETVRFKVRRSSGGGGGGGGIRNEGDARRRPLPPFSCIVTHLHKQPRLHLYANRLVRLRKVSTDIYVLVSVYRETLPKRADGKVVSVKVTKLPKELY
ncbi:hypothetical protein V1477_018757 [Vespula maculifrons]|uniref:Uncharacterized protein n=1 Tax=Vespula maculifrons TaxID=7453 RepID=A0ABD2AWY8_VESMC